MLIKNWMSEKVKMDFYKLGNVKLITLIWKSENGLYK